MRRRGLAAGEEDAEPGAGLPVPTVENPHLHFAEEIAWRRLTLLEKSPEKAVDADEVDRLRRRLGICPSRR